ncbi:uncharacterized protein TNCV_4358551 [Trichonephila clavipes]|nr:uncharacterized protein TNCV_4358551 [Trichonephila clavipes]
MKRKENFQWLPKELHQLKYETISVPQGSVRLVKKTHERKSSTCYLLITKGVTSSSPVPLKTRRERERFLRWITKNNIPHRSQFGFMENRSCIEAVDNLVHHIKNTRVHKHTAFTFIDTKSAFDNVDWSTLFPIFH